MKTIYIVTHGDKMNGPNPGLSLLGVTQIDEIKNHLPQDIDCVICGTGHRHIDTAKFLDLEPDRFSSICGESDSLDLVDGKKVIYLADGTIVPFSKHTSVDDLKIATEIFINNCPPNSLLIAGRPLMLSIGSIIDNDAQSASLYKLELDQKEFKHRITLIYRAK